MKNENYSNVNGIFICLGAGLYLTYVFEQMTMFSVLGQYLTEKFNLSCSSIGNLSAMFFYGNMLMQIPAGYIVDRYLCRRTLIASGVVFVLAAAGMAFTDNLTFFKAMRFLMGCMSAVSFLAIMKAVVSWSTPAKLASMMGMVIAEGMLGGACQSPLSVLCGYAGGRGVLLFNAGAAAVILMIVLIIVRDNENAASGSVRINFIEGLKSVINRQTILVSSYIGLMDVSVTTIGAIWGAQYLQNVYGMSLVRATSVIALIFIGQILGSFTIGYFSDMISSRKIPMYACTFMVVLITGVLILVKIPMGLLYLLFFCFGYSTAGISIGYSILSESNEFKYVGLANSVGSIIIMSSGAAQWLFGFVLDSFSVSHEPHLMHGVFAYKASMSVILLLFTLALFMAFFIRDTAVKNTP